jgi:hypothetical protein
MRRQRRPIFTDVRSSSRIRRLMKPSETWSFRAASRTVRAIGAAKFIEHHNDTRGGPNRYRAAKIERKSVRIAKPRPTAMNLGA